MVIVFLVLMVFVVFSVILTRRLLRKMFAKLFSKFLNKIGFFHEMNSNVVSLIPKIQGVDSIKDFKPIVVNFKFKIIFKILVDGLLW